MFGLTLVGVVSALNLDIGRRAYLASVAAAPTSLLQKRAKLVRDLRKPEFPLLAPDIYYPVWFEGDWSAQSTAVDVVAPCGVALFGGQNALDRARRDIGSTLDYDVRFFRNADDAVVADRPTNTRSLVAATLKDSATLTSLPSSRDFNPNKLDFTLAAGPTTFSASLRCVARYFSGDDDACFETSELVRQSVTPRSNPLAAPSIKDIETLCFYRRIDNSHISCTQRTATWLYPADQQSAVAAAAADGRPVDVRDYSLDYRRRPPADAVPS